MQHDNRKSRSIMLTLGALALGAMAFLAPVPAPALEDTSKTATQLFKDADLITLDKKEVAGGKGTLYGRFSFTRDQALPEHAIKEIGFMRLEPGDSIGVHGHALNEDTYIILSGTGVSSDGVTETQVSGGDITIARPGQKHSLANTGTEPLLFLDIIAQNDAAPATEGFDAGKAQQIFKKDQLITLDKEKVAGGEGTLFGKFSFTRDQAAADQAIKEIGFMRLEPGASIGMHKHAANEDTYIILSGTGTFSDGTTETEVGKGDITLARAGQQHALANTGKEPLLFIDLIAQNDGKKE